MSYIKTEPVLLRVFKSAQKRAREKNLEFQLTLESLTLPKRCPYLGILLAPMTGLEDSPTIDRIDPTKGYVTSNIVICSMRANRIKNDANQHELARIARTLTRLKKHKTI